MIPELVFTISGIPTTNNSKLVADLRIGAVKATVWENEVDGITRHNVVFLRLYRDGDQWKTTDSFGFKNLLTLANRVSAVRGGPNQTIKNWAIEPRTSGEVTPVRNTLRFRLPTRADGMCSLGE